ncbi:hypothetical protein KSP40_PGU010432 [Platanthera guangdongensis]|uniref:Uncharacterized protein n=1 Tax=Platanthera guangdongensis TaxID=2320717 RepID=A0ABR2LQR4_9ASPA
MQGLPPLRCVDLPYTEYDRDRHLWRLARHGRFTKGMRARQERSLLRRIHHDALLFSSKQIGEFFSHRRGAGDVEPPLASRMHPPMLDDGSRWARRRRRGHPRRRFN